MNQHPTAPAAPTDSAPGLSRLSVSLRLKGLLLALLLVAVCSSALFVLTARDERADLAVFQRVERTLTAVQTTQSAKNALVQLRRSLGLMATGPATADTLRQMQTLVDQSAPTMQAAAHALEPIDAAAALRLRTAAQDLSQAALDGMGLIVAGEDAKGRALFRQFPQRGYSAEVAIDQSLQRQQEQLRQIVTHADTEKRRLQWLSRSLHALLFALSIGSAVLLLRAVFRPLQRLYAALRIVARGHALRAPPVQGNDEFAQLGRALHDLSQLTAQLNTIAFEDGLTGLPNRTQFEQDLSATLARKSPLAVVFADIDHFRTINDGYGHFFGDQVLKAVSTRLQWLVKGNTRLYRYSGDLFALVIQTGGPFEAEGFHQRIADEAERLRGRMTEPLTVDGRNLTLCVSLGIALHPQDGERIEALISAADAAMYQAKQLGRNAVQFARHDAALSARRRLELADDLRTALKTDALTPYFQPIVDLGSGSIVCAEALARWKHPVRGFVPPDEFIGIAENSGQIDALTEQLLRAACVAAVQWTSDRGHPPPRLAFNLSPRQVRQGVVEMISGVLAETGLPASRLEIEITESAIIERPETAERLLLELKALGISVALDDFGTGYSSLSYLLRFPIDKIKVDRSFVAQLGGQRQAGKIVAATISLAANLEIVLVAEGVENVGQMVTLYELGCRQQQGWLFSKALPAADFVRWAHQAPLRLDAIVRAEAEAANEMQPAA